MRRLAASLIAAALSALLAAAPAAAEFGLKDLSVTFTGASGAPPLQAGSHPDTFTTFFEANTIDLGGGEELPEEEFKDLEVELPPGLVATPTPVPRCASADFLTIDFAHFFSNCSNANVVGVARVAVGFGPKKPGVETFVQGVPVFNLAPAPGSAAKLGFVVLGVPVTFEAGVNPNPPYNVQVHVTNIPQALQFYGSELRIWGTPADPSHDSERGFCAHSGQKQKCPVNLPRTPYFTMPRSCTGPLLTRFAARSWQHPERPPTIAETLTPPGATGCEKLTFTPTIAAKPTTRSAESGSGLDFALHFDDEGLTSPDGVAQSDIKKAVVTLPEGMTVNPSVAQGLAVCTPLQYEHESVKSESGEGCPEASKVGNVEVETPLLEGKLLKGELYVARQDDPASSAPGAENPFDSLIAIYMVIKDPELGILVKLPGKVEPDPRTGRLITTFGEPGFEVPQFPFSEFRFHFREGARSPLITPPRCGSYTSTAVFTPWSGGPAYSTAADFQISSGPGGAPCPPAGAPPFHPRFQAGALNNDAGSYSPFYMRLQRADGEQDMTKFSSILPPGELGSLAGVGKCPDAAIAVAKAKTGRQELAAPSCPASSLIGHTLAGAGVGEALTYVGGQVYLGGPYHGDPLSVISVTPAVAGPFDAGTVVVRLALTLNPKTAEVEVDGAASDPIPHILEGIVLKVRDLRVYVDRPNFTLNPTSCEESRTKATLFGSFLDVFSAADDVPVDLSSRYQAANCAGLGFKPRLALQLKGGTKRGGHPGLTATYTPRKGDANVKGLLVRLPRSAFLDQAHIRTICTRVQFAAKACPKGAQYGYIKAWTPLLDEPLQGPVWLRSSSHKLPDLVFDLHGLVDVEVATRIDSVKGGIRARVEAAPDAPLSKVELRMQGAKKGLIVNSRDLCGVVSRANVEFSGHNGKVFTAKPAMGPDCGGKRKQKRP
ncbi:MAG: hypothetical protein ABW196_09780 [Solirubrobacterales bacterium]